MLSHCGILVFLVILPASKIITSVQGYDPKHPDLVTDVPYKDCGSVHASLIKLHVTPKCGQKECRIVRGENMTLIAHFIPRKNSSALRIQVDQVDPNFGFSTHLFPEFTICGRRNISCPIVAEETVYSFVLDKVPAMIPFRMLLKVVAMTEQREPYLCIVTPVDLV